MIKEMHAFHIYVCVHAYTYTLIGFLLSWWVALKVPLSYLYGEKMEEFQMK